MAEPTYSVETYDVADDPAQDGDWTPYRAGLTLWGLRGALRELYGCGYSKASIYVSRQDA